jgi:hypothetical protein
MTSAHAAYSLPSTLAGPHALTVDAVRLYVRPNVPGVMALGYTDRTMASVFRINQVARHDTDLQSALLNLIGTSQEFKFRHCESAQAAFEHECDLFHDFRPPYTPLHPVRQPQTSWVCPRCKFFVFPG